jgi:D-glycero-D-manno-heptose 1,7-bisphosphate phosphatase
MNNRHIFLDRDGVINRDYETSVLSVEQFEFLPGTLEALRLLNENGFKVHVVSNQSSVGRGWITEDTLQEITRGMVEAVRKEGGEITTIQYCLHDPRAGCRCRKPSPGMLLNLRRLYNVDPARTFFIGDKPIDVQCGRAAGVRTVLVNSGLIQYDWNFDFAPQQKPEFISESLLKAVEEIILTNGQGVDCELRCKIS